MDDEELDMLAADMSAMLDRYNYPLDVDEDDIRPALPAFIAEIKRNAAADHA